MRELKDNIWNIGKPKPNRCAFYESEDGKYGVFYYELIEYGLMKMVSPVEIWTNKNTPKQILKISTPILEFQFAHSCYYYPKSDLIVLLAHCKDEQGNGKYSLSYCIIDFNLSRFARYSECNYELEEIEKNNYKLKFSPRYYITEEQKKELSKLNDTVLNVNTFKWMPLSDIDSFCKAN